MSVMKPGPDAKPEPFFAIMELDEEDSTQTTGNVWALGTRIMLFRNEGDATAVLNSVNAGQANHAVRGVSKPHLEAMKEAAAQESIEIFVVESITDGQVEAIPIEEA